MGDNMENKDIKLLDTLALMGGKYIKFDGLNTFYVYETINDTPFMSLKLPQDVLNGHRDRFVHIIENNTRDELSCLDGLKTGEKGNQVKLKDTHKNSLLSIMFNRFLEGSDIFKMNTCVLREHLLRYMETCLSVHRYDTKLGESCYKEGNTCAECRRECIRVLVSNFEEIKKYKK